MGKLCWNAGILWQPHIGAVTLNQILLSILACASCTTSFLIATELLSIAT